MGGFEKLMGVANQDPAILERIRGQQASVLDSSAQDIIALQKRLGPSARVLLDEHLTLLRAQEKDLQADFVPLSCDLHASPGSTDSMVETWRHQNDNMISALRCGATRVTTLKAGGWGGIESGGYSEIGINNGHHNAAHGAGENYDSDLSSINRWHAEQLLYLLEGLEAVPEGDGTLLDSTLVVWVNEFGLGDFNHHSRSDVNIVLAGGSKLGFKNGNFLNLKEQSYHRFLFTLANVLGDPNLASFGNDGDQLLQEILT